MKNERSVQIPTIKRWCRRKTSISIKTNPSYLASFLCKSSPVTAWESNTEKTVEGVIFLQRACKGSSVKFRISCQQRRQTAGHCSLSASLLINTSPPNTPSLFTLLALSEETDSGQEDLYPRKFDGYLLY